MPLTFVVGTGRCGSTMLSRILRAHPDVLSISEFFTALKYAAQRWDFPAQDMDGQELWSLLTTPIAVPYSGSPYPGSLSTHDLPLIRHHVLPMLTDDADELLARLAAEIPGWPRQPAGNQYRRLFDFLASALGRRVTVERSGASLLLVARLRELFPEARFVHMHRDGPDCALSMSRHPMFRREVLLALALKAAYAKGLAPVSLAEIEAAAPPEFSGLINPPLDVRKLMSCPIPVTLFARGWWSAMLQKGTAMLKEFPPNAWTDLKYENLLAEPEQELRRLAHFIGVCAEPSWLESARALIDAGRAGRAENELDPATFTALKAACEPGTRALANSLAR